MSKYIVERGDSLWNISKKLLGNAQKYEDIQAINNLTNGKNFVIESLSQGMKFKLLPRLRFVYGEDIFNNISTRDWETFVLDLGINKLKFIGEEININILFNNELALM